MFYVFDVQNVRILAWANLPVSMFSLWLFLCYCFYDSVFCFCIKLVVVWTCKLEPNLYYVSVYGFSLLLLILREKKGGFKNIIFNNIKYCLSWEGWAKLFIFNIISIMFVYFETSWTRDVCCVFSFSQERLFLGEIEEKKG